MNARNLSALIAITATMIACTDFEAPKRVALPDVVVANPQFAKDIQPIFNARCATSSCHTFATHQAGLNLAAGYAYDEIVNVQAVFRPSWKRIVPSKPDSSFLIKTLLADPSQHPEISRMPLGREPLTANQIQTIINWVSQGAVRN